MNAKLDRFFLVLYGVCFVVLLVNCVCVGHQVLCNTGKGAFSWFCAFVGLLDLLMCNEQNKMLNLCFFGEFWKIVCNVCKCGKR